MTRRLRRERWGCRPERGSTFFRCERKYQRKPAARRLREKALDCPFLKEGVRNVARSTVGLPTFTFVRARAHSFPLSKRARLFPSAAYRRSAPPQVALGRLKGKPVGMLRRNLAGFAAKKQACFFHYGWHYAYSISAAWHVSVQIEYFCNAKGQRGFKSTLAFWASRRACRPTAVFSIQLAGNHTRLASRETRCRAAVKPRPTGMSLYASARQGRAEMGAGL